MSVRKKQNARNRTENETDSAVFVPKIFHPMRSLTTNSNTTRQLVAVKFFLTLAFFSAVTACVLFGYAQPSGFASAFAEMTLALIVSLPIFLRVWWVPVNRFAWLLVGSAVIFWGLSIPAYEYQKRYMESLSTDAVSVFFFRTNWVSAVAYLLIYAAVIIFVKNQLAVRSRYSSGVIFTVVMALSSVLAWLVFFLNTILGGVPFEAELPGFFASVLFSTFLVALLFSILVVLLFSAATVGGLLREKLWVLLFTASLLTLGSDVLFFTSTNSIITSSINSLLVQIFWWSAIFLICCSAWVSFPQSKNNVVDSMNSLIVPSVSLSFSIVLLTGGNFVSIPLLSVIFAIFSIVVGLVRFAQIANALKFSEGVFSSSFKDTVTPAWNDAYFSSFLKGLRQEESPKKGGYAVLVINVINLREVNETFGVRVGDELLRMTYDGINETLLDVPVVARLHGGKFAMFFSSENPRDDALRKFNTLGEYLQEKSLTPKTSVAVCPKITGGTASWPDGHMRLEDVVHKANIAVNACLADNFTFYTPALEEKSGGVFLMEQLFEDSVQGEKFVCHYQPKLNIATGTVTEVEALVRWEKEHGLFTAPSLFLPAVERAGKSFDLFKKVLSISLNDLQKWRTNGVNLKVSINVSITEMRRPEFTSFLIRECEKFSIPCSALTLEVLENDEEDFITSDVMNIFHELQKVGVAFSLDDFGSGKSDLARLSELDFKEVKIDKELIRGVHRNVELFEKLQTLVKRFHKEGVLVVTEGVEERGEFDKVIEAGCDYIQGYYVSAPLPSNKVESFLRDFAEHGVAFNSDEVREESSRGKGRALNKRKKSGS